MIVEILADARQVMDDAHALVAQVRLRPDAGQHQYLRRAEGAGRQDHRLRRRGAHHLAAPLIFDPEARLPANSTRRTCAPVTISMFDWRRLFQR